MLNLPSPPAALPFDPTLLAAPDALPGVVPAVPDGSAGWPDFGVLLAATSLPPSPSLPSPSLLLAEAAPPVPALQQAGVPAPLIEDGGQDAPTNDVLIVTAIAQPWALVLVPELASLPAEYQAASLPDAQPAGPYLLAPPAALPESGAAAGDPLGRSVTIPGFGSGSGSAGPWPLRSASQPRLVTAPPAAAAQGGHWLNSLPAVAAPAASSQALLASALPASAPPATSAIVRNITGEPIPYPTAEQPPWYDPEIPPKWFDPANPPPPWSDPTRVQPLWYDPTQVPPTWLDPARIPAAWFDPSRLPDFGTSAAPAAPAATPLTTPASTASAPAASAAVAPATEAPPPAVPAPVSAPPVVAPVNAPTIVAESAQPLAPPTPLAVAPPLREQVVLPVPARERSRRAASLDQPALIDQPLPAGNLQSPLIAAPPLPVAASVPPALTTAAPQSTPVEAAAPDPALSIASERLGDVSVRLSGAADQLQVAMQAQPAAAALIGAEAPRLSQDLAAAGVALASLSVNGQRADLGAGQQGGQRERQRQSPRRDADAPLASVRRLAARPILNRTTSIDRFA